ncbi:TLR4-like protein [Mya arenaria]|uniref:TLR4-like protein n=1 Tax=Mya arenaria TaxID=6604 RepID=A0ABY7ERB9_MYAAR|nr:TLR4-like protein [Mya arenaria]
MIVLVLRLFLLCVCVIVHYANGFKCGPDNKCECKQINKMSSEMNCEATHVKLKDMCDSISQKHNDITILNAGRNNIGIPKANDTTGCRNVSSLNLKYNQISHLEKDVFSPFANLVRLDLSDNLLPLLNTSLADFSALPKSLTALRLTGNFRTYENWSFDFNYPNLTCLQNLKIVYFDGIQKDFGEEYKHMDLWNVSVGSKGLFGSCRLKEIFGSTFRMLQSVRFLDVSSCLLEVIHKDAFQHLSQLEILDLSINRRLGFSPLINISYSLQFTNIKVLNYSHVYTTFGLGTILLKRDICYFRNTSLRELALDGNRMQIIEANALLLTPKQLEVIHIHENKFSFGLFLLQLACLNNIVYVYASHQNIVHPPINFFAEPLPKNDNNRSRESDCPFMTESNLQLIAKSIPGCSYFTPGKRKLILKARIPKKVKTVSFADSNIAYTDLSEIKIRPKDNSIEELDFSNNNFHYLSGFIGPFPNLKKLSLSRCYCSYLGPKFLNSSSIENLQLDRNYLGKSLSHDIAKTMFENVDTLKILNLSTNRITTTLAFTTSTQFDTYTKRKYSKSLTENSRRLKTDFSVDLRNNTIEYSCDNKNFLTWLVEHKKHFIGFDEMTFVNRNGKHLNAKEFLNQVNHLNSDCISHTLEIALSSTSAAIALTIVLIAVLYKNRWKIRYWYYMTRRKHFGYQRLNNENEEDQYMYDAFISYADEDGEFIREDIMPKLEENGMKLCVHQRDFLPGIPIADNIVDAIQNSRKTLVVISRPFIKGKWCMYEFNMARMETMNKRPEAGCLVVVLLEVVPARDMPLELLEWIKVHSYIEYTNDVEGGLLFWDKLMAAVRN